MRRKKIVSMLLVATMAATMFAGCGNDSGKKGSSGGAKEFGAFFAVPGSEINDDNEIQKIIEEKTGVRVKETWLTGQTADEAIGTMIAGGEYPDFIEGASGQKQFMKQVHLFHWMTTSRNIQTSKIFSQNLSGKNFVRMTDISTGYHSLAA